MRYVIGTALTLLTFISMTGLVLGDNDEREGRWGQRDVATVENTQYRDECGSCHMAYQPGLLPERSWKKMMSQLDDHFGENAELDDVDRLSLERYLVENAADRSNFRRSNSIVKSIKKKHTPLRISETRYFVRKHDEVPVRAVGKKAKVKSFSQCQLCHQRADQGFYNEDEVRIPGYGRWDD
ncbi:MAG: diheme cytochrome c [Gammaproteobacteria bacterium]